MGLRQYVNKRWLKRKGCRNVALIDIVKYAKNGEKHVETVITKYHEDRPFSYTSKKFTFNANKKESIAIF